MDGFSIARLSVHRPSKSADCIPHLGQGQHQPPASDDASLGDAPAKKHSRSSLSWLPPIAWRRPQSPPVVIRNRREIHQISAPVPPVLSASLPSSADKGHMHGLSQRRMSASIKETLEPATTSYPWTRRASFTSRHDSPRRGAAEASNDLADLLLISATPGRVSMSDSADDPIPTPAGEHSDKWSDNIQQLIQETERAFEAVGNAISQVHSPSWLYDGSGSAAPSPHVPTRPAAARLSSTASHQDSRGRDGPAERKLPARKASISKSQRRKRGKRASRDVFGSARTQAKTIPWTLAESVGNALGQRFKRVVADEMITSDRVEELKRSRDEAEARLQHECRSSIESYRSTFTDLSDPSLGPFYLESLVVDVDGAATDVPQHHSVAAEEQGATSVTDQDVVRSDFQAPKGETDQAMETEALGVDELDFPSPPKSNSRQGSRPLQAGRLPTIPEVFSAAPGSLRRRPGTRRRCRPRRKTMDESDEDSEAREGTIYLRSTCLSSANRAFRHGPISFQRPEAGKRRVCSEDVDETVDWTAFQMAILGGAGDLATGLYEDEQDQMADDMVAWFETFGFDTAGQLVTASGKPPQDALHTAWTVKSDTELPIPVQSEWRGVGLSAEANTVRFFRSSSNDGRRRLMATADQAWECESVGRGSKRGAGRLLVVGEEVPEGVSEDLAERVPMGCNLEHDLDDFLRWESQFAYGGVF